MREFLRAKGLPRRAIVTAALPYANGRLHVGHLRSTYIPADAFKRYLKARGYDVLYICGTDEHGTPIAVQADKEGVSPKDIADRYHPIIHQQLKTVGCDLDVFSRTTLPHHYTLTQQVFLKLLEKGFIYEKEYEELFCTKCQRALPDRYVNGTCPHCGYPYARGDACDNCGSFLKPTDLIDPRCALCGSTPEVRRTKHWFFRLSSIENEIRAWIAKNDRLPENVRNFAEGWLKSGLRDWCITRNMQWGVPVPIRGAEGKVLYVWFDAPIGYVSATIDWAQQQSDPDAWRNYWTGDVEIYHFIGKDNIYPHVFFWLGIVIAYGEWTLPRSIVAGEFVTLHGRRMQKSIGWIIEIEDVLKNFPVDSLRYFLLSIALHRDLDFTWTELAHRHNEDLVSNLGNFVHRTLVLIKRYFNGTIPEDYEPETLERIKQVAKEVEEAMNRFEFHRALHTILNLSTYGNQLLSQREPWRLIKEGLKEEATCVIGSCARLVRALAILLYPFLPNTAKQIWSQLGLGNLPEQNLWALLEEDFPPQHTIGKPIPLFPKIPEDLIQRLEAELAKKRPE